MGAPDSRFPRVDRLVRAWEFRRANRVGRRLAGREFVVLVSPSAKEIQPQLQLSPYEVSERGCRRLGVTVSRKVGKAVVRNRVKRRIREWFRNHRTSLPERRDIVVIARRSAAALSWRETDEILTRMLRPNGELPSGRGHSS